MDMRAAEAAGIGLALALAVALTLAGCGGSVTVTVACPPLLVEVADADRSKRPAAPVRMRDRLPDLDIYAIKLGAYATALELQAAAREAQVAECQEIREE